MNKSLTPDAVRAAILAHRDAAMHLQSVLIANGRRGSSESATAEVNRAGEAMAKSERDLLAQIGALRVVGEGVTISREDALDYKRRIDKDVFHSSPDGYTELRARQDRLADAIDAAAGDRLHQSEIESYTRQEQSLRTLSGGLDDDCEEKIND